MDKDTIISVKDLHVKFTLRGAVLNVIRGISLDIHQGESIAIVGESGSGKSVFTKTFLGMLDSNGYIDSGEILFRTDDSGSDESIVDLAKFTTEKEWLTIRGRQIAMVMQDPMTSLNPLRTIGKQLEETVLLHHKGMSKEDAHKRAVQLLTDVGINEPERRCKQYPHEFSGGMRQRVVIAIALACDPRVLICDEPTTALDVTIQAQIMNILNDIKENLGTSILLISHELNLVGQYSDEINVMYSGRIVEKAPSKLFFEKSLHPYSTALLNSLPANTPPNNRLKTIEGQPPNIQEQITGCRFNPRCERMIDKICNVKSPSLKEVEPNHFVECYLYQI